MKSGDFTRAMLGKGLIRLGVDEKRLCFVNLEGVKAALIFGLILCASASSDFLLGLEMFLYNVVFFKLDS